MTKYSSQDDLAKHEELVPASCIPFSKTKGKKNLLSILDKENVVHTSKEKSVKNQTTPQTI